MTAQQEQAEVQHPLGMVFSRGAVSGMMCYLPWQESKVCVKPGFLPQKCECLQLLLGRVAVSEGSVSNCSGAQDGGEGTALFWDHSSAGVSVLSEVALMSQSCCT